MAKREKFKQIRRFIRIMITGLDVKASISRDKENGECYRFIMNLLFAIILIITSMPVLAMNERENRLFTELTFARDNTFCKLKNHTIELEIRGDERYTEKKESYFGKYVVQKKGKKFIKLPINPEGLGRYKLFRGNGPLCSKSIGVELNNKTVGFLFLKENSPFKEKLVIQLFDKDTQSPREAIETDYLTDKVEVIKDGLIFKSLPERMDRLIGKVSIGGSEYIFQEQDMSPWISYTLKGFEILGRETYEKSEFKKYFQNETDFFMFTGWSEKEKKFLNPYVYTAVNYELKKECILFSTAQQTALTGSEFWRCKEMKSN